MGIVLEGIVLVLVELAAVRRAVETRESSAWSKCSCEPASWDVPEASSG